MPRIRFTPALAAAILAHDTQDDGYHQVTSGTPGGINGRAYTLAGSADITLVTVTPTYNANSWAEIGAFILASIDSANPDTIKARLFVDAVQRAESSFLVISYMRCEWLVYNAALSGAVAAYVSLHNYDGSSADWKAQYGKSIVDNAGCGAALFCASAKVS